LSPSSPDARATTAARCRGSARPTPAVTLITEEVEVEVATNDDDDLTRTLLLFDALGASVGRAERVALMAAAAGVIIGRL
jgi:hypothetical protein